MGRGCQARQIAFEGWQDMTRRALTLPDCCDALVRQALRHAAVQRHRSQQLLVRARRALWELRLRRAPKTKIGVFLALRVFPVAF